MNFLLQPKKYKSLAADAGSQAIMDKTIAFFEHMGKTRLTEDFNRKVWYRGFVDFIAGEQIFAKLLTPRAYAGGDPDYDGISGPQDFNGNGEPLVGSYAVLTFGADKYGERNWELGMSWGRPFAALMRHMWAWWQGEARDPETGMSHLWHAGCCIAFLIAYEQRRIGTDDRADVKKDDTGT